MGLRLYLDAACTEEITPQNPDTIHKAVVAGADMVDECSLYIRSDDVALTYENIGLIAKVVVIDEITKQPVIVDGQLLLEDLPPAVSVEYALDSNGSPGAYSSTLTPPAGAFDPAVKIWRKVVAPDVDAAFKMETIRHVMKWDEYVI